MFGLRRFAAFCAILAALMVWCPVAHAYEVAPMRVFLSPEQGRNTATITINNIRDEELPVEILVKRRLIAEDGTQSFEPAEDDFLVFPPQVSIPAQRSQAVRLQFIGVPPTDIARAYVIEVAEVPVAKAGFSGVQFAYNFGVAVYVEPPKAAVKLNVVSAELSEEGLKLRVENAGNAYAVLSQFVLNIDVDGRTIRLTPEKVAEYISQPLMAPLTVREFVLPVPELPQAGTVRAEFRRP